MLPALSPTFNTPPHPQPKNQTPGWRIAPRRLLKAKTDAYGERGFGVRVLLRLATTADVRRDDIPAPPPPPQQQQQHQPLSRGRKRGGAWEEDGEGFGGRGGYNRRTVEVVPMEEGEGRRSKCVLGCCRRCLFGGGLVENLID